MNVKVLNYLEKNSPHILMGVGIIGVVVGTVLACKATTKVEPVIEKHGAELNDIKEQVANESPEEEHKINEKKELTKVYFHTGVELARLYLPAVIVMGGSIACIAGSHNILTKRNIALGAAYTALDTCFKEYRQNIIEKYGEEADVEARYSVKAKKVKGQEEPVYEATEKTLKDYSPYCQVFDESNPNYVKNAEMNYKFLKDIQCWANDRLQKRGRLFLNEVYEALGFPEDKPGQVVGWVKDSPSGDNYVDFGLYDIKNPAKRDFLAGKEKAIILDFNVDGNIWALM